MSAWTEKAKATALLLRKLIQTGKVSKDFLENVLLNTEARGWIGIYKTREVVGDG